MWDRISRGELNAAAADAQLMLEHCSEPAAQAEAHAALGLLLQRVGRIAESRDRFTRAADLTRSTPRIHASYVADEAASRFLLGDLTGAAGAAERARRLGDLHANPFASCEALNTLAAVALGEGRTSDALRLTREAISFTAAGDGRNGGAPMAHLHHGIVLIELDRFAEAESAFSEGLRRSAEAGAVGQLTWYHCMRGLCRFLSGHWDAAIDDARTALDAAESTGTLIARPLARGVIGLVQAIRGNIAAATDNVASHEGTLTAVGLPGEDWLAMARAAMAPHPAAAHAALVEGWLHTRRTPYLLSWRALTPAVVHQSMRQGEHELAVEVTEQARIGAERAGHVASATGAALRCQAIAEADPEVALAAVAVLEGSGRPFALASACLDAALLLHAAGHDDRSRKVLRTAVDAFHGLRASPWLAYSGQRLMHLAAPPDVVERHRPDWNLLTPTEDRIARLVASGLSNPQVGAELFISPRTVQTHTSHIYAKLQITSRVQLSALLRQRGPH